MKRTELKRRTPLKASTEPLKPAGETKRKKVIRQRRYYSSAAWRAKRKAVLERAGHQCEWQWVEPTELFLGKLNHRCPETENLQIHHLSTAHFGDERLSELMAVCAFHHVRIEMTQFSYRHTRR